jgi:hypothetical protein
MGWPDWTKAPEGPVPKEKVLYYVAYPDPANDRTPGPFPSSMMFEAFDNIDDARAHCAKLDKGHPPRDFLVIKGALIGHVLDEAYCEF